MGKTYTSKVDKLLTPDALFLISCWVRDGFTDSEIAKKLQVRHDVFFRWKSTHPELAEALSKNRDIVDYMVENALFKRAVGMEVEEKEITQSSDGKVSIKTVNKYIAPDVTACLAWLNNRKPNEWKRNRDKVEDLNSNQNVTIKIVKQGEDVTISQDQEDWDSIVQ